MNPINLEHNHEQDEKKIERQQLRAQVKRKATAQSAFYVNLYRAVIGPSG